MSAPTVQTSPTAPLSTVPYVRLGKSGLKVSKLILGCMTYGSSQWAPWVLDEAEGIEHIKAAYDLGINTFDTADMYSNGHSEIVLGKAIKKHNLPRDEIVVMTKIYATVMRNPGDREFGLSEDEMAKRRYTNQKGLNRKHIFEGLNGSLGGLRLESSFFLLGPGLASVPLLEGPLRVLLALFKAGLFGSLGFSFCWAWHFFQKMQSYARQHNLTEFISMQNRYNAIYREEEREMVPMLQDMGVGMIPYTVLASGFLTRRINEPQTGRSSVDQFAKFLNGDPEQNRFLADINERIAQIAEKRGVSMGRIAIAWLLSKPFVTAPIVGSTSIEKLKDLIGGINVQLSEEEVESIDEAYLPRAVAGHF
ncbi:hypothetical protein M407DRAFT_226354 [Tulasnella calospora MUT 4182]|uniref:NADP-dependent oxidoreductase domain-containing protein n=1 Tax=Tulasnella calospora MUT 4182 TaxID=1051891 RepID=A0A0C3QEZ2_9AGAM|nr:hypothetical protein M407DRAFT_226354 [Tulasnella calospora MUT 4182]